ncbi:YafY family transcriptional regulator [Nocardioides sp. TRM66260-LWL]|uniref:helix-turn-helix transcriptional regulator n=1 Tax=Nocardioides sp. TRM66260-LWL TaxID=2874478 RepID=UPI001CC6F824|nr:YafY family protein [Nocardioides sp. TRM66260-LWL]MBZ5735448.1 YafY family transcriptional regulator [Nocardioides sp. TRM66260-LWL]
MRADRLLSIMLLLRQRPRMSARELAAHLEVSERTILRDVEALSTAGVPIVAERGRHGGLRLLEGFRADVSALDDVEAQVLLASLGLDTFGDLGLSREVRSALDKLTATAPARLTGSASRLQEVVHVDRRRWFAEPDDAAHVPALRTAAMARRRVRLAYAGARDAVPRTRTVDPLGLVENGRRWYLVAYHRGQPRTYRLARIAGLTVLDEDARLPADARLAEVWTTLRSTFEDRGIAPIAARLRVRVEHEEAVRTALTPMLSPPALVERARDDAWVELDGSFRVERAVLGVCLGFGGDVEVLGPPDLRARALASARAAAALHAQPAAATLPPCSTAPAPPS